MVVSEVDDQLIVQLVANDHGFDETLASVLHTVWQAGRQEQFLRALDRHATNLQGKIEGECQREQHSLVESITSLSAIRQEGRSLAAALAAVKDDLDEVGWMVVEAKGELLGWRRVLLNVQQTRESLEGILRAVHLAQRAVLLVADGNYAAALRLLDELEARHVRPLEAFSFARRITACVPQLRSKVRDHALHQMKGWLGDVRPICLRIGKRAMALAQQRLEQQRVSREIGKQMERSLQEHDDAIHALADTGLVFTPLLDSLHLHCLLGRRAEFLSAFAEGRRAQLEVLLVQQLSIERMTEATEQLAGHFILDYHLAHLPQELYAMAQAELRWEEAVQAVTERIMTRLGEENGEEQNEAILLKWKWSLVFLMHCLQPFAYPMAALMETLLSIFYRYTEVSRMACADHLEDAIFEAPLQLIPAEVSLQRLFGWTETCLNPVTGKMPFTAAFSESFGLLRQWINNYYLFLEGMLHHPTGDFDDVCRRTVEQFLLKRVVSSIRERAQTNGILLADLAHLHRDAQAWLESLSILETCLQAKRLVPRAQPCSLRSEFEGLICQLETLIAEQCERSISAILSQN